MTLDEFAKAIEKLRTDALFGTDASDAVPDKGLGPMSEQYYLLALAALDQAHRFATIAEYHRMRKD